MNKRISSTYREEVPSIDSDKVNILEFCAILERLYRCGMMSSVIEWAKASYT